MRGILASSTRRSTRTGQTLVTCLQAFTVPAPAAMLHANTSQDRVVPLCLCRHFQHAVSYITSTLQPTQQIGPFEDVQLGPLLGQGSFGRVYRGVWQGAAVAIKVMGEFGLVNVQGRQAGQGRLCGPGCARLGHAWAAAAAHVNWGCCGAWRCHCCQRSWGSLAGQCARQAGCSGQAAQGRLHGAGCAGWLMLVAACAVSLLLFTFTELGDGNSIAAAVTISSGTSDC